MTIKGLGMEDKQRRGRSLALITRQVGLPFPIGRAFPQPAGSLPPLEDVGVHVVDQTIERHAPLLVARRHLVDGIEGVDRLHQLTKQNI